MARQHNINNLKTEKEAILILRDLIPNFTVPTKDERMFI